ncbi:metalloregulator ArsR/SmtB family transcription factor [candidate division WOR-3 bacterium]|jgi:ArsR family transcriptional regulator|nr:metalloregulator ArsR/SmtB family transcription factor [candidate division WOR-3 bacterium]
MKYKYRDESELLKAFAHPVRLQIIELLLLGLHIEGCSVNSIQKKLSIPQSTISQHLQILRNKGIINGSKTGVEVCYKVIDKRVVKILQILKK